MRPILRDIRLAFALLTVAPMRVEAPLAGERVHAADHFALVGVVFGAIGVGIAWLAQGATGFAQWELVAFSLVVLWALLSRGLHWDGLADVADAWTVMPMRRIEVMKDSRIGAFGVLSIVVCFGVESLSLGVVLAHGGSGALVVCGVVPVFGRLAASFGAWLGTPIADQGLGASVAARPGAGAVSNLLVGGCAAAALLAGAPAGLVATGAGLLAAPVVPHLISSRFGGVNGDVLGASVVVTEVVVSLAAALTVMLVR